MALGVDSNRGAGLWLAVLLATTGCQEQLADAQGKREHSRAVAAAAQSDSQGAGEEPPSDADRDAWDEGSNAANEAQPVEADSRRADDEPHPADDASKPVDDPKPANDPHPAQDPGRHEAANTDAQTPLTTLPLQQLPAASAGPCAFEPAPTPPPVVDNPNCPDGIYHGNLSLMYSFELPSLHGCTRIAGSLGIRFFDRTANLEGLESLRVVDGDLTFDSTKCDDWACAGGAENASLASVNGLENLRCVGGSFRFKHSPTDSPTPTDLSALRNLVEVGGAFVLDVLPNQSSDAFQSLKRVWWDVQSNVAFNPPHLESVYGGFSAPGGAPAGVYVGCSDAGDYCRDGVLGCDLVVTSQAQLQRLSECEDAQLNLKIVGADITDLAPLSKLRRVRLQLAIGDYQAGIVSGQLRSIAGLASLRRAGWITIAKQPELKDLNGFPQLSNSTPVDLLDLEKLEDLSGLENAGAGIGLALKRLPALRTLRTLSNAKVESVTVWTCAALEDLNGLHGLTGSLSLAGLPKLASLAGLAEVQTLYSMYIQGCDALVDLHGLEALTTVGGIFIDENAELASLAGLQNLHAAKWIDIWHNPSLVSLRALNAVTNRPDRAGIAHNTSLPQCEIERLRPLFASYYGVDNGPAGTCEP